MRNKISVIMPCFNSEDYVSYAIESILSQTFGDFEFIIIDDGSSDCSFEEISKYNDSRMRVFRNAVNQGNYKARNFGFSVAAEKYICIMDADDIAYPERLQIQYSYMQANPHVGAMGGQKMIINGDNQDCGSFGYYPEKFADIKIELLRDNCFCHPSLILKRTFLEKYNLSYNEDLIYSADYEFMVRCSNYFEIRNIKDLLIRYRIHPGQISSLKKVSQTNFADIVRVRQLDSFELELTTAEKQLFLKLMKSEPVSSADLELAVTLLNQIIAANKKKKWFVQKRLYDFFCSVLTSFVNQSEENLYSTVP